MEFSYEIEIDAPVDYVYERFSNIQDIASTMPANILLRPEKGVYELSVGSVWVVKAQRSGRSFVIRNKVLENNPPNLIVFESNSNRLESIVRVDFKAVAKETTMVTSHMELKPKGLLGRILLQSIKASKKRILIAMDSGSERLAQSLESEYQQSLAEDTA